MSFELRPETKEKFDELFKDARVGEIDGGRRQIFDENNKCIGYMHPHWNDRDIVYIYADGNSYAIDKQYLGDYFKSEKLEFLEEMYEQDPRNIEYENYKDYVLEKNGPVKGNRIIEEYEKYVEK